MRLLNRQLTKLERKIATTRNEELRSSCHTAQRQHRAAMKALEVETGMTFAELRKTQRAIIQGQMDAEQAKHR